MNYQEIKNQQPILRECFFAFSDKQFNEGITKHNLEGKKIYRGHGGLYGTKEGIDELMSIDQTKHSLFGASKVAADVLVQEYGRYFGMNTVVFRGGCLTGPNHAGAELHGFLAYLIKCIVTRKHYNVFGYKGKQVRDNIHSYDVARFIEEFIKAPRISEVYNIGGGKENTCSILEAFNMISSISGKPMRYKYDETNRIGDHICYYSDLRKMKEHYPNWDITKSLEDVFQDIYNRYMEA